MEKFTIQPHGRLQEWIAHEKGYFRDAGLDYEFRYGPSSLSAKKLDASGKVPDLFAGAFESYKEGGGNKGVKSDISCACHWTVNQAATAKIGTMWGKAYVATPGGIMVPPESPIMKPEDLAGVEVAVGYHSGSHFTTIQALEACIAREAIKLKFVGSIWARVDVAVDRNVAATSVWGLTYQVLDQLGFRKIVDTSFMIGFMFPTASIRPTSKNTLTGCAGRRWISISNRKNTGTTIATRFRSVTEPASTCGASPPGSALCSCRIARRSTRRRKLGCATAACSRSSRRLITHRRLRRSGTKRGRLPQGSRTRPC
jgi:hypothetical protein